MKKSFVALLIAISIIFSIFLSVPSFADNSVGYVNATDVNIRADAGTSYASLGRVSNSSVTVISSKKASDGSLWYKIKTQNGIVGYIRSDLIVVSAVADSDFEKSLLNFPESYRNPLRELHKSYPNWKFVADKLNISFDTALNSQYNTENYALTKKLVEFSYGEEWRDIRAYDFSAKTWDTRESRWTFANKEAIAYFMDPRNALGVDKIFAFLQLSYDDSENVDTLKTVIKGTFLEKGYDSNPNAYIEDIVEASKQSQVSAYAIASKIITEQGVNGTSNMISGTYEGFENCFNFFNFNTYGDDMYVKGLTFAKDKGWTTRRTSIIEGAKLFAQNYVGVNQDTYYYMDYNVRTLNWNHQYASSVYDAFVKAANLKNAYLNFPASALTFRIPVYTSLPTAVSPVPVARLYPDVPKTHEAYPAILYAKENNIFTGYKNGYFGIADNIIRSHFLIALANYAKVDLKEYANEQLPFNDVSKSTDGYAAIAWAYKNGITNGYENGNFGVKDNITREQIVQFLYKFAKYKQKDCTVTDTADTYKAKYSDFSSVSDWAIESTVWALSVGLIHGRAGKYIAPLNFCIRAEAAQMFYSIGTKSIL